TSRNFKRLKEKGSDTHCDRERDEHYLDILPPGSIGIWSKPFVGDGFQVFHLFFQLDCFRLARDGLLKLGKSAYDSIDSLRRQNISLVIEKPLHVLAHRGGQPNCPREKPLRETPCPSRHWRGGRRGQRRRRLSRKRWLALIPRSAVLGFRHAIFYRIMP